ncbi:MAG: RtcB family protein, partial [Candidatus Hinthialibacter sp.]
GAGRRLGRKQAKKLISASDFQKQLKDVIVVTPKMNSIIDEAPAAYKNIEDVMRLQSDMVEVVYRLRPLVVVKG